MANHCVASLPCAPDPDVAMLWASSIMAAAYGDAFAPGADFSSGHYYFTSAGGEFDVGIWLSSPRAFELRRSMSGLEASASNFLLETMGRAFGAISAKDEGIGTYPLPVPGPVDLDGPTWMGRIDNNPPKEPRYDGIHGEYLGSIPRAKFGPPGPIHWIARLGWEASLRRRFGEKLTPEQAASAAMACCSHGLDIPQSALGALTRVGAQRALGVALGCGNQGASDSLRKTGLDVDPEAAARWARGKLKSAYTVSNSRPEDRAIQRERLDRLDSMLQAWEIAGQTAEPGLSAKKRPRV